MTVRELIDKLSEYAPDMQVAVACESEGAYAPHLLLEWASVVKVHGEHARVLTLQQSDDYLDRDLWDEDD
jgi:hypothetical protein